MEHLKQVERSEGPSGQTVDEPTQTCPECGASEANRKAPRGETICSGCDAVIATSRIDPGPEWRAFSQTKRDEKSRVGAPVTETLHDRGLTTQIDWRNRDAYNQPLSADKRRRIRRLRKWQERIRTGQVGERNLKFALSEVDRMGSALDVPDPVREASAVLYRRALNEGLVRGRSIEAVATATLYAACRQEEIPRDLDEMTDVSRVGRTEIARTYRYIAAELNLTPEPINPRQFVPRYCSALDLDGTVERRAIEILETAAQQGLHAGKSPSGFAGGAIYLAAKECNQKRTQAELAAVTNVTKVTIRTHSHDQQEVIDGADE